MQESSNAESRGSTRFDYRATILIEDWPRGSYRVAEMVNYSKKGVRFESNTAFTPGQHIVFAIENSPYEWCPGVYWATIKWCRKMGEGESMYDYGVGAEYLIRQNLQSIPAPGKNGLSVASHSTGPAPGEAGPAQSQAPSHIHRIDGLRQTITPQRTNREKRRHARKPCTLVVRFFATNGYGRSVVKNISKGGAYLLKRNTLSIGQRLLIEFPAKKQRRPVRINSRVAWQDGRGYGVQFKKLVTRKR